MKLVNTYRNGEMQSYSVNLQFDDSSMETHWKNLLLTTNEMYNFVSELAFQHKLKAFMAIHRMCYHRLRKAFPAVPSQICIKVEQAVSANYVACTKNIKAYPKKPLRRKNPALRLDQCLYSHLTTSSINLSTSVPQKRAAVKFETYPKFDELASTCVMKDPLMRLRDGKIKLVIPFEKVDIPVVEETYLGIDLGMKRMATTSDGVAYSDKAYLANRRKIRHNKKLLQSKKKNSHSARKKLKVLRNKERNVSKNFCHHLSNELLKTNKNILVMEDLSKIKQRTSKTEQGYLRKRHNNAMSQIPFYQLRQILTYKAPLIGKRVETVSPYNTSKMDCRNGSTKECKRIGCRFYASDGVVFDADWNAAINIALRKHPISFRLPLDGQLNLVGRVCQPPNSGFSSETCKPSHL